MSSLTCCNLPILDTDILEVILSSLLAFTGSDEAKTMTRKTLASCALVHSSWTRLSQRFLFRSVSLKSMEQSISFLNTLKTSLHLQYNVRSLSVRAGNDDDSLAFVPVVLGIMALSPQLQTVYISQIFFNKTSQEIHQLLDSKPLNTRSLTFYCCRFHTIDYLIKFISLFPALQCVELVDPEFSFPWNLIMEHPFGHLQDPAPMMSFKNLSVQTHMTWTGIEQWEVTRFASCIAPDSLHSLWLDQSEHIFQFLSIPCAGSLRNLAFNVEYFVDTSVILPFVESFKGLETLSVYSKVQGDLNQSAVNFANVLNAVSSTSMRRIQFTTVGDPSSLALTYWTRVAAAVDRLTGVQFEEFSVQLRHNSPSSARVELVTSDLLSFLSENIIKGSVRVEIVDSDDGPHHQLLFEDCLKIGID